MSSPVISVSHLKRGFKSGSGSITVLKDISLTVNPVSYTHLTLPTNSLV